MPIARFDRETFLRHYWHYVPGEHLYAAEPTQQGKSYFLWQMLQYALPRLENVRFCSLMPKPRDPATSLWAPQLGLRTIERWPPPSTMPWQDKPAGYVLWPKHLKNVQPRQNWDHLRDRMQPALLEQFWKGDSLTFQDDAHTAAVRLDLNPQFEQMLTDGGAMHSGLWLANQKPSGSVVSGSLTSFAYSQPTHLVFGHDPDARNIRRMSEIGGVDPELVAHTVQRLPIHQVSTPNGIKNISEKLYINKGGPWMCIVGL